MTTNRKSLLAQIHLAKKHLALSEDAYRAILAERFGVDSAALLDVPGLHGLVRHFEALGWTPERKPSPRAAIHPLCKRIWAQCYSLGRPVPAYADGVAKQMYGIDKLVWLDPTQLRAITTALAKQQSKEGVDRQ